MNLKFLFIIITTLVLLNSCNSSEEEEEEKREFLITSPIIRDTVIVRSYVCQIRSIQHIELRALEKGYLQEIFVDEGQLVEKGQLMFQILPILYEAELQKAQAEADFIEIEYKNTKMLADSNIVSLNELALAKARLDQAKAEVSLAKVHLGFTQIRAPFTGVMDRFQVRLGSLLDEGELMTSLSDNSNMWVYFNVPEAEYLDYRSTIKKDSLVQVQLLMANNVQFENSGFIETIEADFNNETGNIAFRARFSNPNRLLRHGETGSVLMSAPIEKALIIPQKATFEILDKKYVYVVSDEGKVEQRLITVQAELQDLYVIKDGITINDKILLEGLRKVRDNDQILFKYQDPAKVLNDLKLYAE